MTRIRSIDFLSQPIDFEGLRYGALSPTDIDGLYDLKGLAWVIMEVKLELSNWPRGQLIALERLASDLMQVRPTLAIRATHDVYGGKGLINLAECKIHSYMDKPKQHRAGSAWQKLPPPDCTVKELVDLYVHEIWKVPGLKPGDSSPAS